MDDLKGTPRQEAKRVFLSEMIRHGEEVLKENPVLAVAEFEESLYKEFGDRFDTWARSQLKGSSRLRWQNLADWVKAHLTMGNAITYLWVKGERYLVYCPPIGAVHGHGQLISRADALDLINRVKAL